MKIDFDKLKQDHWTEEEKKNADIISDFVQKLMNDHDFDYRFDKSLINIYLSQ